MDLLPSKSLRISVLQLTGGLLGVMGPRPALKRLHLGQVDFSVEELETFWDVRDSEPEELILEEHLVWRLEADCVHALAQYSSLKALGILNCLV